MWYHYYHRTREYKLSEHPHCVFCYCRSFLKRCTSVFKVMPHGCCQADEDIFSICLRFGYLHLSSQCAVHFLNSSQVLLKWRRCVLHLLMLCLFAFVILIWGASGPSQNTVCKSANGVTFRSVRLSMVMKPNTSSGSSSSLSSGTSDCWRKAKRRLKTCFQIWKQSL